MVTIPIDNGLELRLIEPHNARKLHALMTANQEHLRPWLDYAWYDEMRVCSWVEQRFGEFKQESGLLLGIYFQEELVGATELVITISSQPRTAQISYWLIKSMEGEGIGKKACKALCSFAFGEKMCLEEVEACCQPTNTRSKTILSILGFRERGYTVQLPIGNLHKQHAVYFLTSAQWRAKEQS